MKNKATAMRRFFLPYLSDRAPQKRELIKAPARALLRSALQEAFAVAAETVLDGADAGRLVERIAGRSIDPWSAARELMEGRG